MTVLENVRKSDEGNGIVAIMKTSETETTESLNDRTRPTDPLESESRSELSENRSRDQSGEVSNAKNGSVL